MDKITKSGIRVLVEAGDERAVLALFDEDPHRVQRFLKRLACAPDAACHARTIACFRMLSRERSARMPEFFRETVRRSLWEMNEEGGNVAWSAPEIAAAMLQRQQAAAIIDARQKIVEGAVGMVEMALHKLNENDIVDLDEERKAAMVSNLLVVLCGNKEAQPIVNSGSLY